MALFRLGGVGVSTPGEGRFWVAPNATVVGDVRIGEEASIWFNTIVRGDNEPIEIGARTNVQDSCVLHADPGYPLLIGPDCTVGHMVMLHGCRIGRGSLVGIGSIILNGAVVGAECLIGAHTLIPEGKEIPARSVVMGSPGKIVRQATDADLARMQEAALNYRQNWPRFAKEMEPQSPP